MDLAFELPRSGRDRRLAWSLRALALVEISGLLWLAASLLHRGLAPITVMASVLLTFALLRLFVPIGSFVFKFALGDWSRLGRGSPWRVLRVIALESWWMLRLYVWDQPWRSLAPRVDVRDGRPPILLVHGFLCNAAVWKPLLDSGALAQRTVVPLSLEPTYRRFPAQLQALRECVAATLAATKAQQVILIGHSMGGLLSRAYAAEFPQQVAAVVCIAAPHHGTWFGNLVFGRENGPPSARSAWLADFNRRTHERFAVRARNLWTEDDNIVIPALGSRLAHTHERNLAGLGHMGAMASRTGTAVVAAALIEVEQGEDS